MARTMQTINKIGLKQKGSGKRKI